LETSTNSFLEKEKDLQTTIEELESKLEELNQSSAFQKVCNSAHHLMHRKRDAYIIIACLVAIILFNDKSTFLTCLISLSFLEDQ